MPPLVEVAPGSYVRTSDRFVTNTTVVELAPGEVLVVDPAVEPADLAELADALRAAGKRVACGWATHPHWDHVLWSAELGRDRPRFSSAGCASLWRERRAEGLAEIENRSPGHELDCCGLLEPYRTGPDTTVTWPVDRSPAALCTVVEHTAHATGHTALYFEATGLLLAGDMCSEIEIPLLDLESGDPLGAYAAGLDALGELAGQVRVVVPGHGSVTDGAGFARRIAADRRYLDELSSGRGDDDPRLSAPWLATEHRRHAEWVAAHRG